MPFGILSGMKTELSIDKAGRVILPKEVRRQFHLVAGDRLDLQILPDGIFLHAQHQKHYLIEEGGLLVHEGEPTGDLTKSVSLSRSGRDADVLGQNR